MGRYTPRLLYELYNLLLSRNQFLRMEDYYSYEIKGVCIINEYCELTDTSYHQTPRHLEWEYCIHFV